MGFRRTKSRTGSRFNSSITAALNNVQDELRRFGNDTGKKVETIIISSNFTLGNQRPADPGIAVYFRWSGVDACIAVDRYLKIEDNLQAIAKVIEAERAKMRHGGLQIVEASFRGYAALPPPTGPDGQLAAPWRHVLFGPDADGTLADAERSYRDKVKTHHPDKGGDPAKFNLITEAIRQAREELNHG